MEKFPSDVRISITEVLKFIGSPNILPQKGWMKKCDSAWVTLHFVDRNVCGEMHADSLMWIFFKKKIFCAIVHH